MARYRKVDPRIWNDQKFRALTDDGKLAFLFVLTHPQMTSLGAMRGTVTGLAEELGWPPQRMADAISDAIRHGMVVVNAKACFMGLPKFLKYNEPEGPNSVTKAWIDALDLLPECPEKNATISRCRKYLDGKSDAFRHAIGDGIWDAFAMPSSMPCPIQEQEQEQEQEQDPPQPPKAGGVSEWDRSGLQSASGRGPDDAWRDVTECDPQAYESWLAYRAEALDPVPPTVRISHAKFLAGKGAPEQQRAYVDELIRRQFKRLHDPFHATTESKPKRSEPPYREPPDAMDVARRKGLIG